ncbi:hypothetical protein GcC1_088021 [Golovinomyces cichoracearum]|uniref:Uncharacterized protein n=1 Tax=Golovinomyces cichoracearum TaxID=62708 RepID=A0A420IGW3_9PEZI|nr:hypothetical protein GcC1_088021 [Golovinomyces cichoracearum]
MDNDNFSTGAGPKSSNIYLDDDNFREFFRNQELWLKAQKWLELFDSISCTRDAWAAIKAEYQNINAKDVRRLEKQITHWTKPKGLSIKRAWVQLRELRTNLVEIDTTKSAAYTETSLFGYLLEGLDPLVYKTAKNVLDMQPHLTRKEMLDSLQNFFEENEDHAERDFSALAARYTEHNKGLVRFSKSRQNPDSS